MNRCSFSSSWAVARRFALAGVAAFAAASCSSPSTGTSSGFGALAVINVEANSTSLAVNKSEQMVAQGEDAVDNPITVSPTWSVVNGGGTITSAGIFTAGTTPGTYTNTIKATSGSISGYLSITVTASSPASSRAPSGHR